MFNPVKAVQAFYFRIFDRLADCKAVNIVGLGGICLAGLLSFLAWGPARWFFISFVPADAWGGWIAKLAITIVLGVPFGTIIPILLLIGTFVMWIENK